MINFNTKSFTILLMVIFYFDIICGTVQAQTFNCSMPHFTFVNEGVTSTTMSVKSSDACKFDFGMPASVYGNSGIISSKISLQPRHGLVGHNTNRIYVYKPAKYYIGDDQFELKVRYNRDDGAGTHSSILHVDVVIN